MERELERRAVEQRRQRENDASGPEPGARRGEPEIGQPDRRQREPARGRCTSAEDVACGEARSPAADSVRLDPTEAANAANALPVPLDASAKVEPGAPSAPRSPELSAEMPAGATTSQSTATATLGVTALVVANGSQPSAASALSSAGSASAQAVSLDAIPADPQGSALEESWTAAEGLAPEGAEAHDAGAGDLPRERASGEGAAPLAAGERTSSAAMQADAGADYGTARGTHPSSAESAASAGKPSPEPGLFDALAEARAESAERLLRPEQGAEVLKQVRMHLAPGLREATLHLEPAWLGRVSIKIAVRAGRAKAELRAERPEALEALERHLPELRAALAERGFEDAELELELGLGGKTETPAPKTPAGPAVELAMASSLAGAAGSELENRAVLRADRFVDTYA